MKNARKMFRLFKTFQEYLKAKELLGKGELDHRVIIFVLARAAMGGYWVFDNLSVLSALKVLKYDAKSIAKIGGTFWFFGLLLSYY